VLADAFIHSPEFESTYGTPEMVSDTAFVELLFQRLAAVYRSRAARSAASERFATHHRSSSRRSKPWRAPSRSRHDRAAIPCLVGVSPRHLDRLLSTDLGTGFLERCRAMRLDHARKLLAQGPPSISEIAFATGFSSGSHFAEAYKQHVGTGPKAMRLTHVKARPSRAELHDPDVKHILYNTSCIHFETLLDCSPRHGSRSRGTTNSKECVEA
jgi:AraC-like DNA-binding protein